MTPEDATSRFYVLVLPHAPSVLRAARYLVTNRAEADDIAQETMIKAFKGIDGFREGSDMRAWLFTILRNTRIDHARASASVASTISFDQLGSEVADGSSYETSDADPAWDEPEDLMEGFSDSHLIEALRQLPEEIRWTLLLVEIEEMDHEAAAKVLCVPVGTVSSRAFRGRVMLRSVLLPVARDLGLLPGTRRANEI